MDSAVREIPSSAPAQASVAPRASPPNEIATPAINCRRVGPVASAARLFLSLIIVLPSFCFQPSPHESTARKYVQDNISLAAVPCSDVIHVLSVKGEVPDFPLPAGFRPRNGIAEVWSGTLRSQSLTRIRAEHTISDKSQFHAEGVSTEGSERQRGEQW